jgi:hypothetical protein
MTMTMRTIMMGQTNLGCGNITPPFPPTRSSAQLKGALVHD